MILVVYSSRFSSDRATLFAHRWSLPKIISLAFPSAAQWTYIDRWRAGVVGAVAALSLAHVSWV